MPQALAEEFKSIPMSPNLGESLERARRFALDQSHRFVLLEHLLLSLTEDPEASLILQSANVELPRLATDVSGYLGQLLDDMRGDGSTEPRPDAELLRVLQAAASAAQQSKRRQIDGAIVLAAIVGDGKSPAAGLLKTHGMTFEEAIRALQRANTKARLKPIPKAAPEPIPESRAEPVREGPTGLPDPLLQTPETRAATPAQALEHELEPVHPAETDAAGRRAAALGGVPSADDIVAAARARIEKRTGGKRPAAATPAQDDVSDAMRELLANSGPGAKPAGPPLPGAVAGTQGARAPMYDPTQPAGANGFPLAAAFPAQEPMRAPMPGAINGNVHPLHPQRAARPAIAEVPERNPLPPWPAAPLAPGAGMNGAPAAHAEPRRDMRPTLPMQAGPGNPQQQSAPTRKGADRGPLAEAIPRRMRLEVTTRGEVRVAREKVDALVHALIGRTPQPGGDASVARALTVRLRAPAEASFVEPVTPETQWIDLGAYQIQEEGLAWRWHITPKRKGRTKLTLQVSLRSVGLEGPGEEIALPDRTVEVKVAGRPLRTLWRSALVLLGLGTAVALGRVGGELGPLLLKAVRDVTGL